MNFRMFFLPYGRTVGISKSYNQILRNYFLFTISAKSVGQMYYDAETGKVEKILC